LRSSGCTAGALVCAPVAVDARAGRGKPSRAGPLRSPSATGPSRRWAPAARRPTGARRSAPHALSNQAPRPPSGLPGAGAANKGPPSGFRRPSRCPGWVWRRPPRLRSGPQRLGSLGSRRRADATGAPRASAQPQGGDHESDRLPPDPAIQLPAPPRARSPRRVDPRRPPSRPAACLPGDWRLSRSGCTWARANRSPGQPLRSGPVAAPGRSGKTGHRARWRWWPVSFFRARIRAAGWRPFGCGAERLRFGRRLAARLRPDPSGASAVTAG
jgi:hypothetical protein